MLDNPFQQILDTRRKRAVIIDGGFATELEKTGKDLSQDHLWSARVLADDPDAARDVHRSYYEAGADVATTASYQASFEGFQQAGFGHAEAEELLRRSIRLADEARSHFWTKYQGEIADSQGNALGSLDGREGWRKHRARPLVAFSLGPYGAALADGSEYDGRYAERVTEEQLMHFHRQRLQAVANQPGLDLLAFETVPCLKELRAIARLLRTESFSVPAWISCSCREGTAIAHGEDLIEECLPVMSEAEAVVAVGVNCLPPSLVTPLMQAMREGMAKQRLPGKMLLAYPNSGEEWDAASRCWRGETGLEVEQFGRSAVAWADSGGSIIGGCCRTTPGHITALANSLAM